MSRILIAISIVLSLTSCATSKVTAFRDPNYATKRFKALVIFAEGMFLNDAVDIEQQVCKKVAPTPCVSGKTVLPPTRQYTSNEKEKYLSRTGADGVLVIAVNSDHSDKQHMGTITTSSVSGSTSSSGTVNFYGDSAFWNGTSYGSASGQSVSTPFYGVSRVLYHQLGLFDLASGNIAWKGEIRTEGNGMANVTNSVFISSFTSEVADELKKSGLIN